MKHILKLISFAALTALASAANAAYTECPALGANTSCAVQITIQADGSLSIASDPTQGAYDRSDDTLVGVVNNFGSTVSNFTLASSSGVNIFGFEGDGIDAFGAVETVGNPDTSGYGGPITYFTNINAAQTSGTVNFFGGLADGATTYFSLEEDLTTSSGTVPGGGLGGGVSPVPEPSEGALVIAGLGLFGVAAVRRRRR